MTETFTFKIAEAKLNPHSKQQRDADVYCELCGRGIWQRNNAHVVLIPGDGSKTLLADGTIGLRSGTVTLEKFDKSLLGTDSVEWGSFVGSHCAKQIPREFKVSQKIVMKHWYAAGCP